jgi:hypothetical protein
MKHLDDMTQEEIAAEVSGWERGDFANDTWKDAPEAIPVKSQRVEDMTREELMAEVTAWRRGLSRGTSPGTRSCDVDQDLADEADGIVHASMEPPGFESQGSD